MNQKGIFLKSEGDAWFLRNRAGAARRDFDNKDPILQEIRAIATSSAQGSGNTSLRILEIGCGGGQRLAALRDNLGATVRGVDPSQLAVEAAIAAGVDAVRGTADSLSFGDGEFDIVIFGFCLYLCDREDLFKIAFEADRVLKPSGWIVIQDFYSPEPTRKEYHHKPGLYSHKMDYRTLFSWHPAYLCYAHRVEHHSAAGFTDQRDEWVAVSVIRKLNNDQS